MATISEERPPAPPKPPALPRLFVWLLCLAALIGFFFLLRPLHPPLAAALGGAPFKTAEAARAAELGTLLLRLRSLLGLGGFLAVAFGIGRLRRPRHSVIWRTVAWGLALEFIFALLVLDTAPGRYFFSAVNAGVNDLIGFAGQGARFVFGNLVNNNVPVGTPLGSPTMGPIPSPTGFANVGAFFAFNVLPTIVFFSALSTLLYHTGIMQWIVQGVAWAMQRSMKTSGAETLCAAANIFLGQTEAPLMVKPFIAGATKSELMAMMTAGFANIASGVLAAYVGMLHGFYPDIAGHLLAASMISAPGSLVVAKIILPESEPAETASGVRFKIEKLDVNAVDATARGALDGMHLSLNVGAMLIAFIAVIALLNAVIGGVGGWVGLPGLSFEKLLGWIATPFAWMMGISWHDAVAVGPLLGIKTALNEFVAYLQMSQTLATHPNFVTPRAAILTTYALCGFANFSSVAMQIGGISGMAPTRRADLARLGLLAMVGGTISSFIAACIVGILL